MNSGIEFLNRLYKDLYKSPEVMKGIDSRFIGNKVENIDKYINGLASLHSRVLDSGRESDLRILKEFYYQKYVIKEEDIPESYYEHLQDVELELGKGRVIFSKEERHDKAMEIISNQKASLDRWLDYLVSKSSSHIPMWAKYWAFQGMLGLGNYDVDKKKFSKRSKNTISPYINLNKEALERSIEVLISCLNGNKIEDRQLEVLVKSGSFGKIYGYLINNINLSSLNGRWVKYDQGSDHMLLFSSLQGYNTNWCTADSINKAKSHLAGGDFYVYYSNDSNNEAKIPRIAIRMEGNNIAEVRGVADSQNLEQDMVIIAENKLNEFPDKNIFHKKVSNMKMLTNLYKKVKDKQELSVSELRFLYEVDDYIEGFGFKKDPRINDIINKRDVKKDLSLIYNCSLDKIATNINDLNEDIVLYYGGIFCLKSKLEKPMKLPKVFYGYLYFNNLEDSENLELPDNVNGDINLDSLTSLNGLKLPININGSLSLKNMKDTSGLVLPETINGSLLLNSLTNLNGVKLPRIITGNLDLSSLVNVNNLEFPDTVNGFINLNSLQTTNGLVFPKMLNGGLYLNSLKNINGLVLPKSLNGDLGLNSVVEANGLVLPEILTGNLELNGLKTLDGLKLPRVLSGNLLLNGLTNAKGLVLPSVFSGGISLGGLKYAVGLELPLKLDGDLVLSNLENFEDLSLPQEVNGNIFLNKLDDINRIKLPLKFDKIFISNGIVITPSNVSEYYEKPLTK